MFINELLLEKNISKYRLSKESNVPYTTINDICNGKTKLEKCSAETIYKISKVLDVSMEHLIEPYIHPRVDFDLFKSNICHRLKELGDTEFLIEVLESDQIRSLYRKKWYRESLYVLAMLDYVSRENDIPLCSQYNDIRQTKLESVIYPASIIAAAHMSDNDEIKQRSINESIPEFIRFNIVESEVRNVI